MAMFFMSNFAPDKKFAQHFNDTFHDFYLAEKIDETPNYRFDLMTYLSDLNLKAETKYRLLRAAKFFVQQYLLVIQRNLLAKINPKNLSTAKFGALLMNKCWLPSSDSLSQAITILQIL